MIRLLGLRFLRRRGCTCDARFLGVAHDVDCPVHGFKLLASKLSVGGSVSGLTAPADADAFPGAA